MREAQDPELASLPVLSLAVVVLTRSDCGACAEYAQTIAHVREQDTRLRPIEFLKVTLDRGGTAAFKRQHQWVARVEDLPHTILFRNGTLVDRFSASTKWLLLEHLEEAGFLTRGG